VPEPLVVHAHDTLRPVAGRFADHARDHSTRGAAGWAGAPNRPGSGRCRPRCPSPNRVRTPGETRRVRNTRRPTPQHLRGRATPPSPDRS
jgi:hypothetical protein